MAHIFTPPETGARKNDDVNNGTRHLTARSVRAEFCRSTAKRVKKPHDNYISQGPPMLQENPVGNKTQIMKKQ